jgi:hypothetical protein
MANLLEEIAHRLALGIDDGRSSFFKWLGGPLLVRERLHRLAHRDSRGRSQGIKGETRSNAVIFS